MKYIVSVERNEAKERGKGDQKPWQKTIMGNTPPGGGGVLPSSGLMGMCWWKGEHLHNWIHYYAVAFLQELLEWGRTFSGFWGQKIQVCRDLKIYPVKI